MLLDVQHLGKIYGEGSYTTPALNDVSFTVNESEFISIMGPSGSGKTTLLNCISTIDTASSGKINLNDQNMLSLNDKQLAEFRRNNLGFIFQDSKLLDTLTLEENIILPLTIKGINKADIENKFSEIISQLGIKSIIKKFPYEVSGGQKQRCAAARAIITNPKLILADEPTGALDSVSARSLMQTLSDLNKIYHSTILLVTHDAMAASYAQRILFLKDGNIYDEIYKGILDNSNFYQKILNVLSSMEGDLIC